MKFKPTLSAISLAALVFAGTAAADDGYYDSDRRYDRGYEYRHTASTQGYSNRRAKYDYARVLSAEPIIRYVDVQRPVRECYQDTEYYTTSRSGRGSGAGTLLGAIVGGVIGHQFGSGRGNDAATVAGTLIGAAVGNDASRKNGDYESVQHSRPVTKCRTEVRYEREERIDGYRVVYRYKGQKYSTTMPYDPGKELKVRVDVRPAR